MVVSNQGYRKCAEPGCERYFRPSQAGTGSVRLGTGRRWPVDPMHYCKYGPAHALRARWSVRSLLEGCSCAVRRVDRAGPALDLGRRDVTLFPHACRTEQRGSNGPEHTRPRECLSSRWQRPALVARPHNRMLAPQVESCSPGLLRLARQGASGDCGLSAGVLAAGPVTHPTTIASPSTAQNHPGRRLAS